MEPLLNDLIKAVHKTQGITEPHISIEDDTAVVCRRCVEYGENCGRHSHPDDEL